jgi:CheY-like chemotaxis protein
MSPREVLLVDDDVRFRSVARGLLASWGFDVVAEAGTGRDALAAAAAHRPSVVLLDIQLPDLDGFEVARLLLAADAAPVVVLISTREAIDFGRRVSDSGAVGFITKSMLSGTALRAVLPGTTESEK